MELVKKTTILLTEELHSRLTSLAAQKQTSLGELVREACIRQYGLSSPDERLDAVRKLSSLELPIGEPRALKLESVVDPELLAR